MNNEKMKNYDSGELGIRRIVSNTIAKRRLTCTNGGFLPFGSDRHGCPTAPLIWFDLCRLTSPPPKKKKKK